MCFVCGLEAAFDQANKDEGYNELLDSGNDLFEGHAKDTWVYTT